MVDVWSALDNLATAYTDSATVLQTDDVDVKIAAEIATFFSEALAPRTEDPLLWWKINENRLPLLAAVARTYLATPVTPPTSVQSERIFSSAGDVYTEHRTRLAPENAERLIFLKFNLPLLKYSY